MPDIRVFISPGSKMVQKDQSNKARCLTSRLKHWSLLSSSGKVFSEWLLMLISLRRSIRKPSNVTLVTLKDDIWIL